MHLLVFAFLVLIYDIYMFSYFIHMFPAKRNYCLFYAAAVAINIGITIPAYMYLDHRIAVFFMMGSIMLGSHLLFRANWVQIIYASSVYMFSLYSSRGIVCSIYSIVLQTSVKDVLQHEIYYDLVAASAVFLSILSIQFVRKVIVPDSKAKLALYNREHIRFTVIYMIFHMVFLMIVNDGRYFDDVRSAWYSFLYLGACIISKLCQQLVFQHIAKVSELLEYQKHSHKLQEQLSYQIRHYQSYCRFTESYRIFRHDYEKMMTSVKTLLNSKEYERATRMLDNIHDTMQRDVLIHKTYSNNVLLDAILQNAAKAGEEKGIRFWAHAHLPEDVPMSELDIVRVFSNAIDNALEACSKISGKERFIEITSSGSKEWATIEIGNSFNGELSMVGGEQETSKDDKDFHGFGLRIIKEVVEDTGGLVLIELDQEKKIFKIRVCIPRVSSQNII
ncbi:sensor histidine kinase [Lachnoclostridium phytofermentans]|uniref:Signal transduction histidine kinase regulating citrate/malate metabolism n=1 Tax=Lachnoclostridium phytofermentans (strain ATCC 700394 / DSM 18823 / ISDg) TaxID=357809 RepID=A9KQR2_LACP7|nr:GHKL domain-containing protein [Lachnoclostridium phytofermentans]ABX41975.1 signal transduction histidine kinase regulating citrate/malate metabolism [Lachnoclostridium phytofermentans ISDg]